MFLKQLLIKCGDLMNWCTLHYRPSCWHPTVARSGQCHGTWTLRYSWVYFPDGTLRLGDGRLHTMSRAIRLITIDDKITGYLLICTLQYTSDGQIPSQILLSDPKSFGK